MKKEITLKYENWLTEYTFDNCGVGRKEYGQFLATFLAGENDGFVLNLNGKWGTGKTHFLRRLYSHFHEQDHPVIYIDSWESDFTDNPLLVVASELINQLEVQLPVSGSDLVKVKLVFGKALKASMIAAARFGAKYTIDDADAGGEAAKVFMEQTPRDILATMNKGYAEQVEAIHKVREQLGHFGDALIDNKKQPPVMVLVDELDRCRPDYAIAMLEVIKHFFDTKNFVFVVATDTEQLENSIQAVYGDKFDSKAYLRRFFNRKAELGPPAISSFLKQYTFDSPANVTFYPRNQHFHHGTSIETFHLNLIYEAFNLGLRDLDQLIAKYQSCIRAIASDNTKKHTVNVFALLVALVEYEHNEETFAKRDDDTPETDWGNPDFPIKSVNESPTLLFSEYYSLHMNFCVMHTRRGEHEHESDRLVYATAHSRYNSLRNNSNILLSHSRDAIFNQMHSPPRQQNFRIWMWNDYRSLVRLASSIV
ncbi:KAP family P-loop NTPase fold protein [Alteromonas stellipolaris]|uniref:KAP family P-loop NTPase fold protein n=1 Tax=Alteromonas stellipolaris TaxID=233316 RepID=UPI001D7B067D|nr:P-loop NTPase fold protein [Alteromonas stellipolaris]MBZ2164282.1 KAP family NTPase [Alteromonas stellipolaris]